MDLQLKNFFENKTKYQEDGFKLIYLFEIFYLHELRERYGKRLTKLEEKLENIAEDDPRKLGYFLMTAHVKKNFTENLTGLKFIHTATGEDGFSKQKFGYINKEDTGEGKKDKIKKFTKIFENMVSNKELIPDKSCILLNSDYQHLMPVRNVKLDEKSGGGMMKKREKLSQVKGQKVLTDFFSSTKSVQVPYKKPLPMPNLKIEEIVQVLRGDNVKILWLPKQHYELDPSQYVAVVLLNEFARQTEGAETVNIDDCSEIIDRFPDEIWTLAVEKAKFCEEFYRNSEDSSSTKCIQNENNNNSEL